MPEFLSTSTIINLRRVFTSAMLLIISLFLAPSSAIAIETGEAFHPRDAETITTCFQKVRGQWTSLPDARAAYDDCIGIVADSCQLESSENQTTFGMSNCIQRETHYWDAQLNALYQTLQNQLEPDLFIELRQVQRDWITYRDSTCGFSYSFWAEGSIRHVIGANCMLRETALRTIALQKIADWMDN